MLNAIEKSAVVNTFLLAARELGGDLGGFSLNDLILDRYPTWSAEKCQAAVNHIVDRPNVREVLRAEGIEPYALDKAYVGPTRSYAGTQFETDAEADARYERELEADIEIAVRYYTIAKRVVGSDLNGRDLVNFLSQTGKDDGYDWSPEHAFKLAIAVVERVAVSDRLKREYGG
jgi:hypothetical protein